MRSLMKPGRHSVADLERLISSPVDPDYEIWRANRIGRYVQTRSGLIAPSRIIRNEEGSFLTGTNTECIYTNTSAGTAKNTFTTEFTINDTAGMGPNPVLPAYFFMPGGGGGGGSGKALRVTARGVWGTTSAAPTWQHFCRFNAGAPAVPPTGPNAGSIASSTAYLAVSQTNNIFEFEEDIQLVTEGAAGANTTLRGLGIFSTVVNASTPTSLSAGIFAGNASPGTVATFDISATTYITYSVACGTSNLSNAVQLLQLVILGLN